jgi:hypothetical protein
MYIEYIDVKLFLQNPFGRHVEIYPHQECPQYTQCIVKLTPSSKLRL